MAAQKRRMDPTQTPTARSEDMTSRKSFRTQLAAAFIGGLITACVSHADVTMPALFADHMVLQREKPIPVWGKAAPGEKLTVSIASQTVTVTADADGNWQVTLDPIASTDPLTMTVKGANDVVINDILMGEVWVCSGQSNMNMRVNRCLNADQEIASSANNAIRHFQIRNAVSPKALDDCSGAWTVAGPDTVGGYTAAGYFFARELNRRLGVPIGLIHTSWGGTPAEAWTPRKQLETMPECRPILDRFAKALEEYPARLEKHKQNIDAYKEKLEAWKATVKAEGAEAAGRRPRPPRPPLSENHPHSPSGLYNAMIAPLVPYAIRGAIWYQGESNAGRAYQYRTLFPAMISAWRDAWGQGAFPFYFVQLANFHAPQSDPNNGSTWAELREAQAMALALPNTGMACIIDVGEADDIHPKNKQAVGERLALWALAKDYGQEVVYSGPVYRNMTRQGNTIRISFDHVGGGLAPKGDKLTGFAVAGADKTFVWADARIDGDSVLVSSDAVAEPVAVRYGWADNPPANLYNKEGLPAVPFRTDQWTGVTEGKL
jgi:sialate O-acetylesterase